MGQHVLYRLATDVQECILDGGKGLSRSQKLKQEEGRKAPILLKGRRAFPFLPRDLFSAVDFNRFLPPR